MPMFILLYVLVLLLNYRSSSITGEDTALCTLFNYKDFFGFHPLELSGRATTEYILMVDV